MAVELRATNPAINIEILGINRIGQEPFNDLITDGASLPWLQDTTEADVWNRWKVTWRDVRILDAQNRLVAVYNLTTYDLSVARNRETLKQLFLSAARFVDTDGDGLLDDWEILNFGNLSAGPGDDPDGDGQDNFTEYAFGTNPNDANSRTSFRPSLSGTGSNQTFSVSFRRRAGSCIEYFLEGSTDL